MKKTERTIMFHNAHIITPVGELRDGWLLTRGKIIEALGFGLQRMPSDQQVDLGGNYLLPGFIDLHTHGGAGVDFMRTDMAGISKAAAFFAAHGTTAFLATLWSEKPDVIMAALHTIENTIGPVDGGATLLGAHLEGPYLNPEKCGAQETDRIHKADIEEAIAFLETGVVRLLTLAPEIDENLSLVEECVRRGITVSAGHTNADYGAMLQAVQKGVKQVTHCFNSMSGMGHREPGTVGAALASPQLRAELIADNIHVHPAVQKVLVDAKGVDGVILVTDSTAGAGIKEEVFHQGRRTLYIKDGASRLKDGTLAGSILSMDQALRNIISATGKHLSEVWPMTSLNAARSINISARKGSLEAGKDADLVVLDQHLRVQMTVADGLFVWKTA